MPSIENAVKPLEIPFNCLNKDKEYSGMEKRLEELGEKGYLFKKEENYSGSDEDETYTNNCTIRGKINNVEIIMSREQMFSDGVLERTKFQFNEAEDFVGSPRFSELNVKVGVFPAKNDRFGDYERLKELFEKYEQVAYDVNKEEYLIDMEARYKTEREFWKNASLTEYLCYSEFLSTGIWKC